MTFKQEIIKSLKRHWFALLIATVLCTVVSVADVYSTVLKLKVLSPEWKTYFPIYIGVCLIILGITPINLMARKIVEQKMDLELKFAAYSKVTRLKKSFFTKNGSGYILNVIQNVTYIPDMTGKVIRMVYQVINLIVTVCILVSISVPAAIALIILSALIGKCYLVSTKKIGELADVNRKLKSTHNKLLDDTIKGIDVLRSTDCVANYRNEMYELIKKITTNNTTAAGIRVATNVISETFTTVVVIFLMVLGVMDIINGGDASYVYILIIYAITMSDALITILSIMNETYPDAQTSYKNLCELYDEPEEDDSDIVMESFNDSIVFENVSAKYDSSDYVVNNVNIKINKGEHIAFCGESGCGKSTIVNLLTRFYDPVEGAIKIDGINIRDFSLESLREHIAVVTQGGFCFDKNVEDNIKCGRNVTTDEVKAAAKLADADSFIKKLEDGYETDIGPNGAELSGGQKQRINIARALLKDADIIILDEATSALDNMSEARVQKAIDELGKGKTVITVAHRLSTIENCDKIYMIKDHTIAESGTFYELLANDGPFAKLYRGERKKNDQAAEALNLIKVIR